MSRIARVVAVGQAHHVTQRGNKRQDVFLRPGDREMYLGLLSRRFSRGHATGDCMILETALPASEERGDERTPRSLWGGDFLVDLLRPDHRPASRRIAERPAGARWKGRSGGRV